MIKLFRNIRQNLLNEGKTSKYLKYAIGEIILVVIGILIALQINNWNQGRIVKAQNHVILKNLNKEFSENLIQLDSSINNFDNIIDGLDQLLKIMRTQDSNLSNLEFDDILHKTFWTPNWAPSSFVLVELKNSGALSNFNNNNLKTLLFKWERDFDRMKQGNDAYIQYGAEYIEFITKNGSVRNLDALTDRTKNLQKSTIAQNNPELLKVPEFENRADNFYFLAVSLRKQFQSLKEIMKSIIEVSNAELKQ
jgi:hypothetical protein